MSGQQLECILFDLDGTLFDSLPGIEFSVRAAFEACQLPLVHSEIREMIGPPIRSILSKAGDLVDEKELDALERAFRASYDSLGWQKTVCFPQATYVLQSLRRRGKRLFVISNKPRHISLTILKRECMLDYLESILTRDSRHPPFSGKEEMIRSLLTEHKIAASNCLMVGDTMEDANAAAAIDIRVAFMTYGYGTFMEADSVPVHWRLGRLSQLLELEPLGERPYGA
jgi:phosphoglycolate phosphatase